MYRQAYCAGRLISGTGNRHEVGRLVFIEIGNEGSGLDGPRRVQHRGGTPGDLGGFEVLVPNMTRDKVMKAHHIFLTAGTDNKSNESLVRKGSSTKLPMMLILIQFLMWCDSRSMRCEMKWRPRSENQPADDLTNSVYDMFDLDRQVLVDWDCLDLSFLQEALKHLASFELEKENAKRARVDQPRGKVPFEKSVWG